MKLRFLNLKFSENLGDGVVSDCLEWGSQRCFPAASIASIDLDGRVDYGAGARPPAALLAAVPDWARRAGRGVALRRQLRRRLLPFYRERMRDADAVVVGGGPLLSEVDLALPAKLEAALSVAAESGVPVWIYGCGVAERWSDAGHARFARAMRSVRLVDVFLRDEASKSSWDRTLGHSTGIAAKVVGDPGLLAAQAYRVARGDWPTPPRVGVGVISPAAIGGHGGTRTHARKLVEWYSGLVAGLISSGRAVTLVSNGSPGDTGFAQALARSLRARHPTGSLELPSHRTPIELVRTLAPLSSFVGFRLQGLIGACSLGVPTFALDWDRKIEAFMQSIGRDECRFDVALSSPETVVARMLAEPPVRPVNPTRGEAMLGITSLCNSIAAMLGSKARDPEDFDAIADTPRHRSAAG